MIFRFVLVLFIMTAATADAFAGGTLKVNFKNKSTVNVTEIYLVLPGDPWGKNLIAGKPVPPGGRTWLLLADGIDKCVDDIRVVAEGKEPLEARVQFCGNRNYEYYGRK